ncbi:MAG: ribosome biogenesis GTPase Der, partial [Candidatus Thermoplasmatota archaeon]|nr:ribosome biogenesis GTPase Der [Candidatus Thermoplasmatota archaeon]
DDYKRYLESSFRKAFKLQGTPLRIQIKEDAGKNPFEGKKRAPLTESEATRMRRKKRVRRKVYGSD